MSYFIYRDGHGWRANIGYVNNLQNCMAFETYEQAQAACKFVAEDDEDDYHILQMEGDQVEPKPPIGKIYDKRPLFMHMRVGTAKRGEGEEYEMEVEATSLSPIVHAVHSGRTFTLSWPEILRLASEAGIDVSAPAPEAA